MSVKRVHYLIRCTRRGTNKAKYHWYSGKVGPVLHTHSGGVCRHCIHIQEGFAGIAYTFRRDWPVHCIHIQEGFVRHCIHILERLDRHCIHIQARLARALHTHSGEVGPALYIQYGEVGSALGVGHFIKKQKNICFVTQSILDRVTWCL